MKGCARAPSERRHSVQRVISTTQMNSDCMVLAQFETAVSVWCLRRGGRGHGHNDGHACDAHRIGLHRRLRVWRRGGDPADAVLRLLPQLITTSDVPGLLRLLTCKSAERGRGQPLERMRADYNDNDLCSNDVMMCSWK